MRRVILIGLASLGLSGAVKAASPEWKVKPLRGIGNVRVVVDGQNLPSSVTEREIQTTVELKLRRAGVSVVEDSGYFHPFVAVLIACMDIERSNVTDWALPLIYNPTICSHRKQCVIRYFTIGKTLGYNYRIICKNGSSRG